MFLILNVHIILILNFRKPALCLVKFTKQETKNN